MAHSHSFGDGIVTEFVRPNHEFATPYNSAVLSVFVNDGATLIPELREAIRLKPKLAASQVGFHLTLFLTQAGKFSDAISTIRKAPEQEPDSRVRCTQLMLPIALIDKKMIIITILQRLRETAIGQNRVTEWIDRTIQLTQRLMAIESVLPKLFHGGGINQAYLTICQNRHLHASAAKLWSIAFEVEPLLLEGSYLDSAARSAALAGCGIGKDHPMPNEAERAKLRAQALKWFRAEFSATVKTQDKGSPESSKSLLAKIEEWQETPDFAGVRDPEALDKLPEAERASWRTLWVEIGDPEKRFRATLR